MSVCFLDISFGNKCLSLDHSTFASIINLYLIRLAVDSHHFLPSSAFSQTFRSQFFLFSQWTHLHRLLKYGTQIDLWPLWRPIGIPTQITKHKPLSSISHESESYSWLRRRRCAVTAVTAVCHSIYCLMIVVQRESELVWVCEFKKDQGKNWNGNMWFGAFVGRNKFYILRGYWFLAQPQMICASVYSDSSACETDHTSG